MESSTILVVEDEAITAMELQNDLQKLGYHVPATVSSGEEAISVANDIKPDLVLMDIVLKNKMDGTEAARHISKKHRIPIVFLTAYSDVNTFNRAKLSAPYGYITKPYEENNLRMAVELALFKRQMEIASEAETMRLKNEFLRNMSHEIRTPLNGINGFIELMRDDGIDLNAPENKEMLKGISSESHRLLTLVDGVLELTEIESGKMEFFPTTVDLDELIREVIDIFPGIEADIQVDPVLVPIITDSKKFKEVLYNFVSNAIKFSPPSKKIEILALPEDEKLFRIEVRDHGIGIREEDINKLFLPFQQLDMGMAKKYQGAGLGLVLTHHIVEAQGGEVGVTSTPGKGSNFFAKLPRVLQV